MKKNIIFIICILIFLLILSVVLIVVLKKDIKEVDRNIVGNQTVETNVVKPQNYVIENNVVVEEIEDAQEMEYSNTKEPIKQTTYFYTIQDCVKKYLKNINEYNNLINILDVLQLNVKNSNVIRFALRAVYVDEQLQMQYFNCIVYLDYNNLTYLIEPIDNNITDLQKVDLNKNINEIKVDDNNKFVYIAKTEEDEIDSYFSRFKLMLLNTPEIAFEYLAQEYRESRFGNIENFKNYINENETDIIHMRIESFKKQETDEYDKYICTDCTRKVLYFVFKRYNTFYF